MTQLSQDRRDYQLVLASQSPRRAQLLQQAGYQFTIVCPPAQVEDEATCDLPAAELVMALARAKGRYVAELLSSNQFPDKQGGDQQHASLPDCIVLAADTVAECQRTILGKPIDRDDAARMLRKMSGQEHRVLTAVSLWRLPGLQHIERLETTSLIMDRLSESDLDRYLDSGDWQGKAGAFGYQDGLDWVHITHGLASNVVGLPVERLDGWLQQLLGEPR